MKTLKAILQAKFKQAAPKARLLAIHLNGFSHSLFYDNGSKASRVIREEYSNCAPEISFPSIASAVFNGLGHSGYQNNPKEIVYIMPEAR